MARLVFLGSPLAAVPTLRALVDGGHDVCLVVSQPDRRRGRGAAVVPSPVKAVAADLGLPVTDDLHAAAGSGADLGVVVAYGRIVPGDLLQQVPMVNVHFSLLPRWRGAAPVERAILAGDRWTGVTIMRMEAGLDTGPLLANRSVLIGEHEPAPVLTGRLAELGARLLVQILAGDPAALPPGEPQSGEPTYAAKLDPWEFQLDWAQPAEHLERVVRLGRAWTTWGGRRLRVLEAIVAPGPASSGPGHEVHPGVLVERPGGGLSAGTGSGLLDLQVVQVEGRRPVAAVEWARGVRLQPGDAFGAGPADG